MATVKRYNPEEEYKIFYACEKPTMIDLIDICDILERSMNRNDRDCPIPVTYSTLKMIHGIIKKAVADMLLNRFKTDNVTCFGGIVDGKDGVF